MDSNGSRSATLSPAPMSLAVSSPPPVESSSLSLKRKITPSLKGKAALDHSSRKRPSRTKMSGAKPTKPDSSHTTMNTHLAEASNALTPPTTPARPLPTLMPSPSTTSKGALLTDNFTNPLPINRFNGLHPTLVAKNTRGPFQLRYTTIQPSEDFIITGLLQSHDMTIVKEGTEVKDQLQAKSTLTLFFVDSETFATCVGDQMNAIDAWIRVQPGFQLPSDKVFRSPFDPFNFTVDLTWPQYERTSTSASSHIRAGRERREMFTMKRKERLDPASLDDENIRLLWDDIKVNSVLRAEVNMTAYKDERNHAYAGWTINVSDVLLVRGPFGDLPDNALAFDSETVTTNSSLRSHNRLRF